MPTIILKDAEPAPESERTANQRKYGALIEMWANQPGQTELEIAMSHGLITRVRTRDRSEQ